MHLRRRISDEINARVLAALPDAMTTVWDTAGVVVLIEQAKFQSAGGFTTKYAPGVDPRSPSSMRPTGFERLFKVDATVRAEVQTDDLAQLDLGDELITSLLVNPIHLPTQDVAVGAISEFAQVRLTDARVIQRDARLVMSLTLTAAAEVVRYHGPGVVPDVVDVPVPFDGVRP